MKNRFEKVRFIYIVGWIVVFIALFLYMQLKERYSFYFTEQWNIFLYDWPFVKSVLWQPGGLARLIADFLIQFFIYPYCGALISAFLLTSTGIITSIILKRLAPALHLSVLSLLPVISFLFLQFNINYQLSGTVAFLLFLCAFVFYLKIQSLVWRIIYTSFFSLLLYWLAGPVASLFVAAILITELFVNFRSFYYFLLPVALVYLSAVVCLRLGVAGELKYLLLPDGYFTWKLQAGNVIYQPWLLMLAILLLALLLGPVKRVKKNIQVAGLVIQFVVFGWLSVFNSSFMIDSRHETFKELDYYMRQQDWDKLLERCSQIDMNNYLYQNCRNVALAEKGLLAENLFDYKQGDLRSIYLSWDKTPYISVLLSDVYFSMGHIALSQRMAFESNESVNNYNPRMLKRLIQTNLIYGAYPVAKKYIAILEKTKYYADWARSQRRFLENDKAVEDDTLLGSKRECIFPKNVLSGKNGFDSDLKHIIDHNPTHQASIQYLGAIYLLMRDIEGFKTMVEKYYDTPALPALPKGFQEGVMLFAANDTSALKHYAISDQVIQGFEAYKNKRNSQNMYLNFLLK
ncbi:DUF6057 family protein [uncultured Draconibacterium sp.]|uniref:DUF6057 family protein n=1 Tax=uncultured Draconibacterium sp. TaxID=1573823 RepID=UPI0029C950A9|nr:DUF6057 family protein [uncultured Draconibacterium sp.]